MPLCLSKLLVGAGLYPSRLLRIRSASTPLSTRRNIKPRDIASEIRTMNPFAMLPPVKFVSILYHKTAKADTNLTR